MSAALVNRSLSTLKTELEFLRDSNVITENFYEQFVSKLPDRYQNGAAPIDFPAPSNNSVSSTDGNNFSRPSNEPVFNEKQSLTPQTTTNTSASSNEEYVEAIYDYSPQQPEDLGLRAGDKIKVLEHVSPDWWRGENQGKTGMFPSNYVKPAQNVAKSPAQPPSYNRPQDVPSSTSSPAPKPQQQQQYYAPPPQNQYYAPPPQQQQFYSPPQQMVPFQAPSPQPPQQVVVQQPEPQEQHNGAGGHLKKFGSKLGNAAIFGAGATLGSDLVNSIF